MIHGAELVTSRGNPRTLAQGPGVAGTSVDTVHVAVVVIEGHHGVGRRLSVLMRSYLQPRHYLLFLLKWYGSLPNEGRTLPNDPPLCERLLTRNSRRHVDRFT